MFKLRFSLRPNEKYQLILIFDDSNKTKVEAWQQKTGQIGDTKKKQLEEDSAANCVIMATGQ